MFHQENIRFPNVSVMWKCIESISVPKKRFAFKNISFIVILLNGVIMSQPVVYPLLVHQKLNFISLEK